MALWPWSTKAKPAKKSNWGWTKTKSNKHTKTSKPDPVVTVQRDAKCPHGAYVPHHRNLGLKPWATDEEIKDAWKQISRRMHPDKIQLIRDPIHRAEAEAAMLLVNRAYEALVKDKRNRGPGYPYRFNWLDDRAIDSMERARRLGES